MLRRDETDSLGSGILGYFLGLWSDNEAYWDDLWTSYVDIYVPFCLILKHIWVSMLFLIWEILKF